MYGTQNVYYALGILAYAMAKADGEIQKEEKEKLARIVKEETDHDVDFDYADIIFQILEKDNKGYHETYAWAISEFEKASNYVTPEIKDKSISVIKAVAEAFDSVTQEEEDILDRFKRDIEHIAAH